MDSDPHLSRIEDSPFIKYTDGTKFVRTPKDIRKCVGHVLVEGPIIRWTKDEMLNYTGETLSNEHTIYFEYTEEGRTPFFLQPVKSSWSVSGIIWEIVKIVSFFWVVAQYFAFVDLLV